MSITAEKKQEFLDIYEELVDKAQKILDRASVTNRTIAHGATVHDLLLSTANVIIEWIVVDKETNSHVSGTYTIDMEELFELDD